MTKTATDAAIDKAIHCSLGKSGRAANYLTHANAWTLFEALPEASLRKHTNSIGMTTYHVLTTGEPTAECVSEANALSFEEAARNCYCKHFKVRV